MSDISPTSVFSGPWPPSASAASIEGVRLNVATLEDAVAEAVARAGAGRGFTFFTFNLDHLAKIGRDLAFRAVYLRATLVTADGWPIAWLAARQGARVERVCGSDLVVPLCSAAAVSGLPVGFIGPRAAAQADGIAAVKAKAPRLKVAFAEAPEFGGEPRGPEIAAMAERLAASQVRLCFVCLGAPKQELLADALAKLCPEIGFLCVGAALDFLGGHAVRAPEWAQAYKLEWAWRLAHEPRRLGKRYAEAALAFGRAVTGLWG